MQVVMFTMSIVQPLGETVYDHAINLVSELIQHCLGLLVTPVHTSTATWRVNAADEVVIGAQVPPLRHLLCWNLPGMWVQDLWQLPQG